MRGFLKCWRRFTRCYNSGLYVIASVHLETLLEMMDQADVDFFVLPDERHVWKCDLLHYRRILAQEVVRRN